MAKKKQISRQSPAKPRSSRSKSKGDTFKQIFWEAREFRHVDKSKAIAHVEDYSATLKDAPEEANLLGALVAELNEQYDAGERLAATIPKDSEAYGLACFLLASIYSNQKDPDAAIGFYHRALDESSFNRKGNALNNLGIEYAKKTAYDAAIECYRKALNEPSYDTPGRTYCNLASVELRRSNFDAAVQHLEKSLESADDLGRAHFLLGIAKQGLGCQAEAKQHFADANRVFLEEENTHLANLVDKYLRLDANPISTRRESDVDAEKAIVQAVASPRTVESRMYAKLEKAEEDCYQEYEAKASDPNPYLIATLRGWSSTVPLLHEYVRGGGYFIKWSGFGLAIDPGHQFLLNFFEAGFHIREINTVLVTHNHGDHNQDLKPIDDLLYEMNSRANDRENSYRYSLIWDSDSESHVVFEPIESPHRSKLKYDFDRLHQGIEDKIRIRQPHEAPFDVQYFKARHSPDVPNAVGVRVTFLDESEKPEFVLGFSGDTSYFAELCEQDKLGGCDLLIAHISQPDSIELVDPTADFKRYHLGYRGTAKLIQETKPRLTVIGEFWAGLADMRIDLINGLRAVCKTDAIFPSSRSLRLDPRNLTIQCTNCERYADHSRILVAPAQTRFGPLSYLCDECRAS